MLVLLVLIVVQEPVLLEFAGFLSVQQPVRLSEVDARHHAGLADGRCVDRRLLSHQI